MVQILSAAGRTRWDSVLHRLNPHVVDLGVYKLETELRYSRWSNLHGMGSAGPVLGGQTDGITQAEKDAVTETGGPNAWTNLYGVFDGVQSDVAQYQPRLNQSPYVDFDLGRKVGNYRYYFNNPYGNDWPLTIWLYGSNDSGSREDNLVHYATGLTAGAKNFDVDTLGNYRYWRLKGYKGATVWWRLYEVYFYSLPQFLFVNVPSQHTVEVYNDDSLEDSLTMSAYDYHTLEFLECVVDDINRLVLKEADGTIYYDQPFLPEFMHKYAMWPMGIA